MRECLREIAELPPRIRIVFFGEQADIVAKREQALEQGACFGVAVLQLVIIGKPEAAREKDAFSRRQAINVRPGSITQHKAVDHELPLDCRDLRSERKCFAGLLSQVPGGELLDTTRSKRAIVAAGVLAGFGPYVAVYLADQKWPQEKIGWCRAPVGRLQAGSQRGGSAADSHRARCCLSLHDVGPAQQGRN
jgi:hypothetical protein